MANMINICLRWVIYYYYMVTIWSCYVCQPIWFKYTCQIIWFIHANEFKWLGMSGNSVGQSKSDKRDWNIEWHTHTHTGQQNTNFGLQRILDKGDGYASSTAKQFSVYEQATFHFGSWSQFLLFVSQMHISAL